MSDPLLHPDDKGEFDTQRKNEKISLGVKFLYAGPQFGGSGLGVIVGTTLLTVYNNKDVGPSFIAITQFVAGLMASYLQLVLGYLGDRTTLKFGRRRPYMLFGAPISCAAIAALYLPPSNSVSFNQMWFAIFYSIYVIFREFASVPYNALGTELTQDDADRKSLYSIQTVMGIIGMVIGVALNAFLPIGATIAIFALINLLSFLLLVFAVKERPEFRAQAKFAMPLIPGIRSCLRNRPWVVLMMSGTTLSLLNEIVAMFQYLVQYQFKLSVKSGMAVLLAAYMLSQMVLMPLVYYFIRRKGKLFTWRLGACSIIAYGVIGFFVTGLSNVYAYAGCIFLFGAGLVATNTCLNIFISDTIDYDELLTGKRRESTYHSIGNLPSLFFSTAGKAVPLVVLAAAGFQTGAKTQNETVLVAIRGMVTLFPAAILLVAMLIFNFYTLDEPTHDEVMEGLKEFHEGGVPTDPFTKQKVVRETLLARVASKDSSNVDKEEREDITTYLLYFTPNDLRMLASRWKLRVVAKMAGATFMWFVDTFLAVWASILFLIHGDQEVAFIGLTLGALFSIGLAYEGARFKGVRWVMSQTKQQLVAFTRAYMFQHRKADPESAALQLGNKSGAGTSASGAYSGAGALAWQQDADAQARRAAEVVDFTTHSFHDDTSGRGLMMRAMCRFSIIHAFCFVVCLITLLVALNRVSY